MKRTAVIVLPFLLMSLTAVAQESAPPPPSEVSFMLPPSAPAGSPSLPSSAAPGHAPSPSPAVPVPPGTVPVNAVPSPGMTAQPQTPPVVSGRLYAIHASGGIPQKLKIDKRLKPLKSLFSSLPFTSYEAVAVHDKELPWGEETLFPVNAVYTLKVMPLSMNQEGAVALQAHVEMLQDGAYVNALNTLAEAHMNQALLFRGLPAGADELLLVFIVTMPSDDQNQQDQQDQEDQEDQQDQDQNQDQQDQDQNQDQQDQEGETSETEEPAVQEGEEESPETTDLSDAEENEETKEENNENLEALLQSLEETDRREQVEERNKRRSVEIKGNWW